MIRNIVVGLCFVCVGCIEPAFAAPPVPSAPGNLEAVGEQNMVTLTWVAGSKKKALEEDGTKIERSLSAGGPWTLIGVTAEGVEGLQDANLDSGTTYFYRITAKGRATIVVATTPE